MGYLLVLEGDHRADGPHYDIPGWAHAKIMELARSSAVPCPLVRRMSDFYRDTSFDLDEVLPLAVELKSLSHGGYEDLFRPILGLCERAATAEKGIETVCD